VRHWGSQLGVGLRAAIAKVVRRVSDHRARVLGHGRGGAPAGDPELSLDARLARFDPERHGGEVMVARPFGTEHP